MKSSFSKPLISVIIPTFNRADLLSQSLESLVNQSLPRDQFEVVVIDDGSSDCTKDVCADFEKRLHLRYQRQENSGIAAAKNMGVFISRGRLLLFFDDDDVADTHLLKEHIETHTLQPEETTVVLGYTTWHPSLTMTHIMNFVTDVGHFLFSYSNLKDGQTLDFTHFWGGRSSCKKSLIVKHGIFNQLFRFGSEDIELGYRLSKFGLKVIYNANAKSFMMRPMTYDQFCQRCVKQGKSQYHFSKIHADPVIQNYCMMDRVDEKWTYVRQSLESRMERVRDLESTLENHHRLSDQQIHEMGNLYWWTFNALKIKGIIEAKESDNDHPYKKRQPEDSDIGHMPINDIGCLIKQWGRQKLRDHHRGNVLIIDPFLPMFDRASGSLRLFEIIKALIRMGFQVTYISRHGEHAGDYVPLLQNMGVEVYAGDPMALQEFGLYIIGPYLDIEKILRSKRYDYVILSFWHIAEYYLPIIRRHSPESHIIIDTVDIHFLREFREAEMKGDRNLLASAKKNKERELSIYRKADRLWVVTEDDRKAIKDIITAPIDAVPNIHKKIDCVKEFDLTSDLIFVGNFRHTPNIDAVLFFHKKIYPLIRKRIPDAKVFIVGNNPPEQFQRLHSDQFIITGYVEDLSPYLRNARISINPMTYGAGMKGKIGEALSWGIPVVTTSIGAEGMHLKDNEDALITDDPKMFGRKVIDLYNDRGQWEKLSANGKKLVEQRWSPNAVQKRIDSSLLDVRHFYEGNISLLFMSSNDSTSLKNSLNILLSSVDGPGDTLVIDRSHNEETARYLLKLEHTGYGRRHVLVIRKRPGIDPVCSWNKGLSQCTGEMIVLCRESQNIDTNTLQSLISFADRHPDIDLITLRTPLLFNAQQLSDEYSGKPASASMACLDMNPVARVLSLDFMLIRPSVLKNVGGFDTAFNNDHLAWFDFIVRSSLKGYEAISIEESRTVMSNAPHARIDEIDIDINDWDLFIKKWNIPEEAQLPMTFSDVGHKDMNTSFELFSSLGELDTDKSPVNPPEMEHNLSVKNIDEKPVKLTSIIILCFNQIIYTQKCLQSIDKYTSVPYELILVDNGSTDGTQAFLKAYSKKHTACTIILNESNRGFAGGNNQGIAAAKGDYILLLNNDVIVTSDWLKRLIAHIESDSNIGMAGPVSNSVSGPQQVEHVTYGQNINKMQQFARNYSKYNVGRTQEILRLVGFCLLIKRQVLDIIGGLDENYGNGNYEDDDLCLRSRIAGFRNIIARDVFIYHYGSITFKGNKIDYTDSLEGNRRHFADKWKDIIEVNGNEYRTLMTKEDQLKKLLEWGEERFSQGNFNAAVKIFERVLKLDKANSQAMNNLGVIQWQIGGEPAPAMKTFQTALTFNPKDQDALGNLVQAATESSRFDLINPALLNTVKKVQPANPDLVALINAQQNSVMTA